MKVLNNNYKVIKIKSGHVVIPIIPPPKYYIGEVELTEYDVRNIQLEVALGNLSHTTANELEIVDENGVVFNFREDGKLINKVKGYDTISNMVLDMIREDRKK
jgi:hypothetical protein